MLQRDGFALVASLRQAWRLDDVDASRGEWRDEVGRHAVVGHDHVRGLERGDAAREGLAKLGVINKILPSKK